MKKTLLYTCILLSLTQVGCGVWLAEWQGNIKKTELKAIGEAKLLEAESTKKTSIEEAKAKLESAKYLSLAEIERAKGVAEANRIIGDSLKNNESYLRYLYIQNLEKAESAGSSVIYIPTEAGLPILESSRLKK
jgi:regulator of protease activity HflC (stomatin/prohibitin superfamily)